MRNRFLPLLSIGIRVTDVLVGRVASISNWFCKVGSRRCFQGSLSGKLHATQGIGSRTRPDHAAPRVCMYLMYRQYKTWYFESPPDVCIRFSHYTWSYRVFERDQYRMTPSTRTFSTGLSSSGLGTSQYISPQPTDFFTLSYVPYLLT